MREGKCGIRSMRVTSHAESISNTTELHLMTQGSSVTIECQSIMSKVIIFRDTPV